MGKAVAKAAGKSESQHRQEETTSPVTEVAVECRGSALQGTGSSTNF